MERVAHAARDYGLETGGGTVRIISGLRTPEGQRRLRRAGRNTAPDDLSTHMSCPATGVDITLGLGAGEFQQVTWGRVAMQNGLRWGGGGELKESGIPVDWQHVDRGPRR